MAPPSWYNSMSAAFFLITVEIALKEISWFSREGSARHRPSFAIRLPPSARPHPWPAAAIPHHPYYLPPPLSAFSAAAALSTHRPPATYHRSASFITHPSISAAARLPPSHSRRPQPPSSSQYPQWLLNHVDPIYFKSHKKIAKYER